MWSDGSTVNMYLTAVVKRTEPKCVRCAAVALECNCSNVHYINFQCHILVRIMSHWDRPVRMEEVKNRNLTQVTRGALVTALVNNSPETVWSISEVYYNHQKRKEVRKRTVVEKGFQPAV